MTSKFDDDKPFFRLESGKNLTLDKFNEILKNLTKPYVKGGYISGHSFRSGLISLFADMGLSEEDLRAIGRWSSRSFELYIKLDRTNRAQIARLIANSEL